ncbi:hypothetical protein ACFQ3W_25895 [Paenibacillus puldeungensis]|uniref:Uncharacterized protein n=1 Tax=Paenibacillus puldeungensis TaxID=696536 RepID=A0ABW3S6B4_9BACL
MKDERKNIKVIPEVKESLESIRKELELKTESLTLAYLVAMYLDQKDKNLTLQDHQNYIRASRKAHGITE